ncbi:hypothetical protein EL09_20485 [Salmonella enterica subsp. enterica]|nr:hypothetical protein [Salmonella enterica subsp. enterica]
MGGLITRENSCLLYSPECSFLAAFLRSHLRYYEMKNPRNGVDFIGFYRCHEIQQNLMRQQMLFRR